MMASEQQSPIDGREVVRWQRWILVCVLAATLAVLAWHISDRVRAHNRIGVLAAAYSVVIAGYVLSRFVLAAFHRAPRDAGAEPTIAIIIPAYNEGVSVRRTIDACLAQDYPSEKLQVICIDDGSTDDTRLHLLHAAHEHGPDRLWPISLGTNQGKRAAIAQGIRSTDSEIIVLIDSDSEPAPGALRRIVQGFSDERVAAVSGITHARNGDVNSLTRMQAARYFISYQLLKAAESVLGAVTCCSGCFSAYRRSAVTPVLGTWEQQTFLGRPCTSGDDRSLTNLMLRTGHRSIFDPEAIALTDVPTTYASFFRQQLRWKKSWFRESLLLLAHSWRTRPFAFPFLVIATIVGVLGPMILVTSLVISPAARAELPLDYLFGFVIVSAAYGAYHRLHRADRQWAWAIVGTGFYLAFSAQIFWAIARVRDGRWGTRS